MAKLNLLAALALTAIATPAAAERIVGLVGGSSLTLFDSATPGDTSQVRAITGLGAETLVGIDVRPATDGLYGLGNGGGIFTISLAQGNAVATRVAGLVDALGAPVALTGTAFGIDFNPVPDRLRVVSNADQNLRINVDTGATLTDGTLSYAVGDVNEGVKPSAVAVAYTNSFTPSPRTPPPGTALFYLDSGTNTLATTSNPNGGVLNTLGGAGNPNDLTGFDISGDTGVFYASWLRSSTGTDGFFTLAATGTPTLVGNIGSGTLGITDVAVAPGVVPAPAAVALFALGLGGLAVARRR